ncbi:MAG: flagella basal body P-ring formation protein FlgA [Erythrobacter sp.]|nr:flagella basal body P-ring formation protein FlgA [Erythrobacter sp.]
MPTCYPTRLSMFAAALFATGAQAQDGAAHQTLDARAIDEAVAAFTGAPIGTVGGARSAADPRLKLAQCGAPLVVSWHGNNRSAVKVACPDPGGWRIFVAVRASEQGPSAAAARPVIARGDPVTVVVRGAGFSVQQAGEALEAGAVGDWIALRTARTAEPVRARIERPGLAVIPIR